MSAPQNIYETTGMAGSQAGRNKEVGNFDTTSRVERPTGHLKELLEKPLPRLSYTKWTRYTLGWSRMAALTWGTVFTTAGIIYFDWRWVGYDVPRNQHLATHKTKPAGIVGDTLSHEIYPKDAICMRKLAAEQ